MLQASDKGNDEEKTLNSKLICLFYAHCSKRMQ